MLQFHPLSIADREAVQAVTLCAGRRNCNYTFANLVGWQFRFHTEVCVLADAVVLRFTFDGERACMVCSAGEMPGTLVEALLEDSRGNLTILGLEDLQAQALLNFNSHFSISVDSRRNQYDYIYRRADLAALHGGLLKAKRNHVNHFRTEHPDFEYYPLTPDLFDECRRLTASWSEEKAVSETIEAEHRVMETVFSQWEELGMIGGAIFIGKDERGSVSEERKLVAFTYGAPVTDDTFDVCVEKADRHVEGAFAIINQQFAEHLPEQYIYLNREEDMGLPGLRKSKLSYHPNILLSYNVVYIK